MLHSKKIIVKILCAVLAVPVLLGAIGCADDRYTPPPAETQKQDKSYESSYNSSVIVTDQWEGEACSSLLLHIYMLRDVEDYISHVEISAGEALLGVVAFGRSLPSKTVDGERIFTLTPDQAEATRLNDGTSFRAQLYFKGQQAPSVRVSRIFNTHTSTSVGEPHANMEAQRLLTTDQIKEISFLPQFTTMADDLHFAGEVGYQPDTGVYRVDFGNYRFLTITPSDGKFEKNMQYEMEHGYYMNIECYPYEDVNYYIVEGWPTGPDVGEEEHTFSVRWEKDGWVYTIYLDRAITSHSQGEAFVQGIRYQ
ncbi:MAG: hypothetical protein IJW40_01205 [Clostridia bacterium]|nr:hypothetical protein [Clostridia bacterium]